MTVDLTQDDRGKTVVYQNNRIGTVTDVESGTAYVDPDLDHVPEQLRDQLDWTADAEDYTLDEDAVTAVQNSEVRLRTDLVA
ncbi:PRC-barrel domain containing protein [Halosimplex aquaticum]|uniref:PRC-barrel domain containing protein n=1 Tax=Halosimplex aquaticum TaxID=3026162 RepID=A0ABD5YB02_9EURY